MPACDFGMLKKGRGVALGQILFVLPKMWSKLELSLMRLLRAKFGKICQWTKKIKDAVVYGWGTQIFPKSATENKNSLPLVEAHEHFIIVYKSVLSVFTQEFSLVVWLRVRPENEPKKLVSADIFGSFGPTKKIRSKKILSPPPPPPPPVWVWL